VRVLCLAVVVVVYLIVIAGRYRRTMLPSPLSARTPKMQVET
jgi:hypothetical protein